MNKVILYIATSQDGFIADRNGGVDWLPQPKDEAELEIVGYKDLISSIDTILVGSISYKQIIGFGDWLWTDKQTYVFTSKPFESEKLYIKAINYSAAEFVSELKGRKFGKNIWLLGGACLAQSLAKMSLIDQVILTIIPKTLGEGIPLALNFTSFELTREKILMDSMIQRFYLRKE